MYNHTGDENRSAATVKQGTAVGRMIRAAGRGLARGFNAVRHWCARRLPGGEVTFWVILGLLILALLTWGSIASHRDTAFGPGGRGMADPQPVGVAVARKGDIDVTLKALGTVTPLATATVTPQVSGTVMRVNFREGQMVRAAEPLALIDPRTYKADLDQARGQLAKDQASLVNAQAALKRQRALSAAKATSQQDLDSAVAAEKEAAAAVQADRASVSSAAVKFGFTRVSSPISGRIGLRSVDPGNYVSAGQTTGIAVVAQMNPMSVVFSIPEDALGQVIARLNAGAHIPVAVLDRPQAKVLAEGELSAVDSQISTSTGTLKMRALFDNDDEALFPNQFVNVKILVDTLHDQVVVPSAAIMRGSQGTYVFVVRPDHTVAMRAVKVGIQDGDNIAITKGLNPGETVVVDGGDRLSDGAPVTIPSGRKVASVTPAESAGPMRGMGGASDARRALFRKLTPEERENLHGMDKDARKAWLQAHKAELMKRKDQPRGPGGPGRSGPPPM